VLCGGLSELVKAGLNEKPCVKRAISRAGLLRILHEVQLIVDLHGQGRLHRQCARFDLPTPANRRLLSGPSPDHGGDQRRRCGRILVDIQDGTFAKNFVAECEAGKNRRLTAARQRDSRTRLSMSARRLRSMFSWPSRPPDRPAHPACFPGLPSPLACLARSADRRPAGWLHPVSVMAGGIAVLLPNGPSLGR